MSAPVLNPSDYATPTALWAAVRARAETAAKNTGLLLQNVLRQFVYDRFLARVFQAPGSGWVLKGGAALLSRVRSARHSQDIDLVLVEGTLDMAIGELRVAAGRDLRDHLTFEVVGTPKRRTERPHQPGTELAIVTIHCFTGTKMVQQFTVDLVVGSLITQDIELLDPAPLIAVTGIPSPPYQVYPVVDHVADKVCATFEQHAGHPSGRIRDLVDLVVIARTQRLDAEALRYAIRSEEHLRGLNSITHWSCPATWATQYAQEARGVAECADYGFTDASALVSKFLDPVLGGDVGEGYEWYPTELAWQDTAAPD